MKIPFSPPYIDDDVKQEVMATLDSGWITSGPRVLALEKLVAENIGIEHVACCSSATAGMMLMLHWFGVGPGDEVIIPSYTYAATALVVMHVGATPVMVDVTNDFNIDVSELKDKITEKTKAIMPVDIAGWPCDYEEIYQVLTSPSIAKLFRPQHENQRAFGRPMVLSDAAHSIGAQYHEKPTGLWADFTVFSFHAVKNITTAEGGVICINPPTTFNRAQLYKQLKLWSLNGQTKDAFTKTQAGGWRYDIVYPGFKMNMPDICAAIGLAQFRKYYDVILPERKRVFNAYTKAFSVFDWAQLPPTDMAKKQSSYHLYALRINNITEVQRDAIIENVTAKGVSVNVHFLPLPMHTIFKERGYQIEDFPVAYDNYSREISLPIYPELTSEKINYIVDSVAGAYQLIVHA